MKIICSDYDGTLNHNGITPEKLSCIKKWQKNGNLFTIVSGRGKEFFPEIKEENIPIDFLLACNGAVILDSNGSCVSDVRCRENIASSIVDFVFSLGCTFAVICTDKSFRIKNPDFPEEEGILPDEVPAVSSFNQISTACADFDECKRVTALIKEKFGEYVNPLQNGTCIDIVPYGMDKAQGIYILTEKLGASYDDIIAVGDNVNDEAMIKEFYSYAMKNGVDFIKALADNETSGIEELIEKELLK